MIIITEHCSMEGTATPWMTWNFFLVVMNDVLVQVPLVSVCLFRRETSIPVHFHHHVNNQTLSIGL